MPCGTIAIAVYDIVKGAVRVRGEQRTDGSVEFSSKIIKVIMIMIIIVVLWR